MNRDDAEELTQALAQSLSGSWRTIARYKEMGVPASLGLSTEEWVVKRLGGYIRLSIAERREAVKELTDNGGTTREVAEIVGVSHETVANDVRNLTAERRKASEDARKVVLETPADPALPEGVYAEDFFTGATSDRIADESVDLVFTDPPYDKDSAKLYGKAARVAARILKPGGSFIAYSGQKYLPDVYGWINQPALRYWWTFCDLHAGGHQMLQKLGVRCGWKPIVWYVKGTRGDVSEVLADVVSGAREKDDHEWQQAEVEARHFIEKLTFPGGLVVDFFLGSGTTKVAADKLGRRFIGFEINAETAAKAAKRIQEAA